MKYAETSELEQDVTTTNERLSQLKELVLIPSGKEGDIKNAIDELKQAHESLIEQVEIIEEKKKKEAEEAKEEEIRQAIAKAQEELRAQQRAEQAAGDETEANQVKREERRER